MESSRTASLRRVVSGLEKAFVRNSETRDGAISTAARVAKLRGRGAAPRAISLSLVSGTGGGASTIPGPRYFENLGIMLGSVDSSGLEELDNHNAVAQVVLAPEFSLIRPVATAKAAIDAGPTWGLKALKVPELRAEGLTGKGVLVGHLDTGVDASHPALKDAVAQFAEFDLLGRIVPGALAHDTDEHGTHTAGTIAGRTFKKAEFGVAPGASGPSSWSLPVIELVL
jgi:subtilisin family serine protease